MGEITRHELSEKLDKEIIYNSYYNTRPIDVEIEGRTLVNELGRAGNGLYKGLDCVGKSDKSHTITYIDDKIEVTLGTPDTCSLGFKFPNREIGSYYIAVYELTSLDENISSAWWWVPDQDDATVKSFGKVNKPGPFAHIFKIVKEENNFAIIDVRGKLGGKASFKNVRVYKITEAKFNEIKTNIDLNADILSELYPYVDDAKCIVNPYIESKENLLDVPLTVGMSYNGFRFVINEVNQQIRCCFNREINLKSGETYTLNSDIINKIPNLEIRISAYNGNEMAPEDMISDILGNWGTLFDKDITFTMPSNSIFVRIALRKTGDVDFTREEKEILQKSKTSLVKGNVGIPYDQCHNSRIVFETKLYEGEKIVKGNDGEYIKNKEFNEITLDKLTFKHVSSVDDCKCLTATGPIDMMESNSVGSVMVSYNGSVIHNSVKFINNGEREIYDLSANVDSPEYWQSVSIKIPNKITGWGPDYSPTPEEIKAFFLGWRMYHATESDGSNDNIYNDSTHTQKKGWQKLFCGKGSSYNMGVSIIPGSEIYVCPDTINDQAYVPYKLIYRLEKTKTEKIKTHGYLTHKSGSTLNINSGLIIGEKIPSNGFIYPNVNEWHSHVFSPGTDSSLSNKLDVCVNIRDSHGKNVQFINGSLVGNINKLALGRSYIILNKDLFGSTLFCDYLIYKPDTVSSYNNTLKMKDSFKENLEELIKDLSNTNHKLSDENVQLRNKIESLPVPCNPNILINGDFKIWQRSDEFNITNNSEYTCDRWMVSSKGSCTLSKKKYGVKFVSTLSDNTYVNFQQFLELPYGFSNKTVTMSVKLHSPCSSINMFAVHRNPPNEDKETYNTEYTNKSFISATFKLPDLSSGKMFFGIQIRGNNYADIEYIKLEIGNNATPLSSTDYNHELLECQRYFERIGTNRSKLLGNSFISSGQKYDAISFNIVEKRTDNYTIVTNDPSFYQIVTINNDDQNKSWLVNDFKDINKKNKNTFLLNVENELMSSGKQCMLQVLDEEENTNAWIDVDAEIY